MQPDLFTATAAAPLVVAYGMGVDSTAMLVGMAARGIRPDAILFADTGAEKAATYAYLPTINAWLERAGFPQITVVRYQARDFKHYPPYATLEQNCLTNGTLPSEAFGFGSCSLKWKATPQKAWLKTWAPAVACWRAGMKVRRAIGFDDSCADQKRRYRAEAEGSADALFDYWYPLQEWHWTRDECERQIAAAGLPVPPKSSCFFCPNMTPAEVSALEPQYLRRIVFMESRAQPRLTKIDGLWRNGVKGKRDPSKAKPGRMSDYIRLHGLLPAAEIDRIETDAPRELLDRAEAFANGLTVANWDEVFAALGQPEPCIAV